MNIAIITPGFSADEQDWCIPVLQDHARLLAARHRVRVFSITYPHRRDRYTVKGVPVVSVGDGKQGWLAFLGRMYRAVQAIVQAHRIEPFDLVHGFWADQGGVVANVVARRLGVPSVVTVMAGELTHDAVTGYGKKRQPISGRLAQFGARGASVLLANSEYHAASIRRDQPGFALRVVPLGCETQRFCETGPVEHLGGEIPILCVGSLVPVKGHEDTLRAFASISAEVRGAHLHLVGDGPLKPQLEQQAVDLGIADAVTFHGHVDHDRLPSFYRGAAFCVLGSYFESLGMVILEAAACGRVTVGSKVGVMPEFVSNSLLVNPGDTKALARIIQLLVEDPDYRDQVAAAARAKLSNGYELAQSLEAIEGLFVKTVNEAAAR